MGWIQENQTEGTIAELQGTKDSKGTSRKRGEKERERERERDGKRDEGESKRE